GQGFCQSDGVLMCIDGQEIDNCTQGSPLGDDSDCNGIDDDCDGIADDDFQNSTTTCGLGVCESSGLLLCIAGSEFDTCGPTFPTGSDDDCDGLDNDCDGSIDEEGDCTPLSCFDSDGGDYSDTYGYVNSSDGFYQDECTIGPYGNLTNLMEYYCTEDVVDSKEYTCDQCTNGECICNYARWDCVDDHTIGYKNLDCAFTDIMDCGPDAVCNFGICYTCADTDGGDTPLIAGTLTTQYGYYFDTCTSSSKLKEYKCSPENYQQVKYYDCNCENGACLSCFEKTICINSTNIANQYADCSVGEVAFCEFGCDSSSGECRFCTDSDGGINYNTKGKITYGVIGGKQYDSWDICSGSKVGEKYCKGSGTYYGMEYYECPNGCNDGACVS
ncbi:MAG: hypothetical protein ABIC04_04990, partial [Nanoarchaeota archaeon]